MPTGAQPDIDRPWPHCPACGMPLDLGITTRGRRAWFCISWSCRFYDTAVEAWYKGSTDSELHFRREYERRREKERGGC
jgi:hypothetical protein